VNENEVVEAIRELVEPRGLSRRGKVKLGVGDDAALWQPSRSHRSAISTDMHVEGVHFTRNAMALADAGWRAMAAGASDLAAMGARPVLATVALGVPPGSGLDDILECYRGLAACAARCKLAIVGGDLSRADALTIAITVVGEVRASYVKTRAAGRPGDVLAVTGALGASRAGLELTRRAENIGDELIEEALLAFRLPEPRIAEGRFLAASGNVRAMMDLSDGLSTDVHRLAASSGCGAEIESIPVAESARALARARGEDPERFGLAGGEDFELLAAIKPRAFSYLAARFGARFGRRLSRVGVLRVEPGVVWNGVPVECAGWDHFAR
jgi:thiamine-monophosphate kinase